MKKEAQIMENTTTIKYSVSKFVSVIQGNYDRDFQRNYVMTLEGP